MSAFDLKSLHEKRETLLKQNRDLLAKVEGENRDLNDTEKQAFEKACSDIEGFHTRISRMEKQLGMETDATRSQPVPPNTFGNPKLGEDPTKGIVKEMNQGGKHQYRITRAIRSVVETGKIAGFEGEISQEIAKRTGQSPKGFFVPFGFDLETRDLNSTTGDGALQTEVMYDQFVDLLRNQAMVAKLGATILTGLVGTIRIPRQNGAASFHWVASGGSTTASYPTVDHVELSPKQATSEARYDKEFIKQTSMSVENFIRDDLTKVMALGIDLAATLGSGTSGAPTGILNTDGVSVVHFANPTTWANVLAMEGAVASRNAEVPGAKLAYLTSALVRQDLKARLRSSVAGSKYIWDDNDTIAGHPAAMSNQLHTVGTDHDHIMIYGNWQDVIIGMYNNLDILVDPFSLSSDLKIKLIAYQQVDIALRHPESFVYADNLVA